MRQLSFIMTVALCLATTDQIQAQRQLPGMQGIQLSGGMVDGFHSSDKTDESGYYFGVALATYVNSGNKWVFGAEYFSKYYPYKEQRIPVNQFTAEGAYYLNFLSSGNKAILFYLGGSALVGYATSNWGEKLLFDGATLQNRDAFIYGGAVTLQMDTYLSDQVVLLLNARERLLWGTSTGHFHFQIGVGLKFIIN